MTRVLLIYPFFVPRRDRSVFRFPPLGVTYLAASLREAGHDVYLIDCTFRTRATALQQALAIHAEVVGIYGMVSMLDECLWFAAQLRPHCQLLVAGGPLQRTNSEGSDAVVSRATRLQSSPRARSVPEGGNTNSPRWPVPARSGSPSI